MTEVMHDRDLLLAEVLRDGRKMQLASEELRKDKQLFLNILEGSSKSKGVDMAPIVALKFMSEELRKDRDLALAAVRFSGLGVGVISAELRRDRQIALAAVTSSGMALGFLPAFNDDKEVVLAAVEKGGSSAMRCASERLRRDWDVALAAMSADPWGVLPMVSDELKQEKGFWLAGVQRHSEALQWLTQCQPSEQVPGYQEDEEVALAAVQYDGLSLKWLSDDLRSRKNVVLAAVQQNGTALEFAPLDLKRDKEVVLEATRQHGRAIAFTTEKLQYEILKELQSEERQLAFMMGVHLRLGQSSSVRILGGVDENVLRQHIIAVPFEQLRQNLIRND